MSREKHGLPDMGLTPPPISHSEPPLTMLRQPLTEAFIVPFAPCHLRAAPQHDSA